MSELTQAYLDDSLQKLDEKFERRFELQRQSIEGMLVSFSKMIVDVLDERFADF